MAGIIVLKSGDWHISSSGFREMAGGVMNLLPDTEVGLSVKSELATAVESELYFVDFTTSFTSAMLDVFKSALARHVADVARQDPATFPIPDLYEGHLQRLQELYERLADSATDSTCQ